MLKKGRKTVAVAVILVVLLFSAFAGISSGQMFRAQALESGEEQAVPPVQPKLENAENADTLQETITPKAPTYKVVFETDGGSKIPNIVNIPAGTKIPKPQDPVKNGYDFKGWYTSPNFNKNVIWVFHLDEVWEDTVLYAYWVECSTTVVPPDPEEPSVPTDPSEPSVPTDPSEPSVPTDPSEPSVPTDPSEPSVPTDPSEPSVPTDPSEPSKPTNPGGGTGGGGGGNPGTNAGGSPPNSGEEPPTIIEVTPPPLTEKPGLPHGGSNRIGIAVVTVGTIVTM